MDVERQKREVDRNYDAFTRMLGELLIEHRDQLALMRDERVVGFFNTHREAREAGERMFADGIFSIQEVTDEPIWHGYYDCPDLSERAQAACEPLPWHQLKATSPRAAPVMLPKLRPLTLPPAPG